MPISIAASVGYKASCVETRLFNRVLSTDVTYLNFCEKNNVTTTHPNETATHFWVENKRLRTVEIGGVAWASAGGAKRAFPPLKLGLRTKNF